VLPHEDRRPGRDARERSRRGAAPRDEPAAGLALLVGMPLSFVILFAEYGLRRDLVQAMFWPMFWVKVLFPLCIAAAGFVMVQRLARPGVAVRHAWAARCCRCSASGHWLPSPGSPCRPRTRCRRSWGSRGASAR
jgi:hypothetical protein